MNITVMSYQGSVDFGIIPCERSVPPASDIALGFGAAVADLHKLALEREQAAPLPRSKMLRRRRRPTPGQE